MNPLPDLPAVPFLPGSEEGGQPLPAGWSAAPPAAADVAALHALLQRHESVARGWSSAGPAEVEVEVTGPGAAVRRHLQVRDDSGSVRAWGSVHDRAAGRVLVSVVVDPDLEPPLADTLAAGLFAWAERGAEDLAGERGLESTQLDSGAFASDARQQRWLAAAGFDRTRTWFQMSRPVTQLDEEPPAQSHPDLRVRRVARAADGMPDEDDLRTMHEVLEEAFTDHFNYHPETFAEFLARLREDPGHRWDHWWIAELTDGPEGSVRPAGALVGTVLPGAGTGPDGSYVAYLGVLRSARGRGAAKSLLHAVISDAARRGRDRVGLEVDADSPTGAVDLYAAMGFRTAYVTESWHRDLVLGARTGRA
ncbi:GNAT family N-acetyltransferase [Actinotalea sp.]|uniref:GNAT family N-acetyltransferase n=1 Tax=Actinotalea sp. TaxID=1872145 RepID=UPI00356A1451